MFDAGFALALDFTSCLRVMVQWYSEVLGPSHDENCRYLKERKKWYTQGDNGLTFMMHMKQGHFPLQGQKSSLKKYVVCFSGETGYSSMCSDMATDSNPVILSHGSCALSLAWGKYDVFWLRLLLF